MSRSMILAVQWVGESDIPLKQAMHWQHRVTRLSQLRERQRQIDKHTLLGLSVNGQRAFKSCILNYMLMCHLPCVTLFLADGIFHPQPRRASKLNSSARRRVGAVGVGVDCNRWKQAAAHLVERRSAVIYWWWKKRGKTIGKLLSSHRDTRRKVGVLAWFYQWPASIRLAFPEAQHRKWHWSA